jgi:TRAP-type mannitol/chloroaromatic compound transport system permease small subunit
LNVDASKLSEVLPHTERLPNTRFSLAVRQFFVSTARWVSWVWIVLIGVVVLNVTMRYLFSEGRIEFEEIQWHLYAIGFLIGLATCMDSDDHIRVDIFHERMSLRSRAWIELYGLLLLFLPFVVSVLIFSVPFVAYSYASAEVSDAAGGLAYRWLIKSVLPLGMILLLLSGLSRLSRVGLFLFGAESANTNGENNVD